MTFYRLSDHSHPTGYCHIAMSVLRLSIVCHPHFQLLPLARVSGFFILYCMLMVPGKSNFRFLGQDVSHLEFKMTSTQIVKTHILLSCPLFLNELHTI